MRKGGKLASFFILLALLCAVTAGCGEKEDEYGNISEVDIKKSVVTYEADSVQSESGEENEGITFKGTKDKLGYEYAQEHIGRCDISIPYPKTWTVTKKSDYNICFTAPAEDPHFPGENIWFHSTLQLENDTSNQYDVLKRFNGKMQKDNFNVAGRSFSMMPSSSIEKTVVNDSIVAPEYQSELSYRDWDASVTPAKAEIYHQSTTFYWKLIPCILSGMTKNENADKLNDLLLYMMSNAVYTEDEIDSVRDVDIFEGTTNLSLQMCPIMRQYTNLDNFNGFYNNVVQFSCPMDSGTGFSQVSATIYETKKKNWGEFTEDFFNANCIEPFLKNMWGYKVYNNAVIHGYLEDMENQVEFGDKKANEYMYHLDLDGVRDEGYFEGQAWNLSIFPIENGEYVDIVVVGYPAHAVGYGVDIAALIAATLESR